MKILISLIEKDILEIYRTKKLIVIIFVFLFVALTSPITAKLMPEIFESLGNQTQGVTINIPTPTYEDSIDQYMKNTGQLAVLILLFVLAGAIADEKSKRYLEMIISKPIPRSSYILSKFITYLGTIKIVFLITSTIFVIYTTSLFGDFSYFNFFLAALLVLLYLLTILSITLSVSTLVKNGFLASGAGIFALFLFGLFPTLFSKYDKYIPGFIFSNYEDVITNGWINNFLPSIFVSIFIIIFSIILAVILFKNQEVD